MSTGTPSRADARIGRRRSSADLAIVDATVRTGNPDRPLAEAISVRGGRIATVGDTATVLKSCDARTEIIAATGVVVTPGLVDAHIHPFWAAELANGADCSTCTTVEELRVALLAERNNVGAEGVVRGYGVNYGIFATTGLLGEVLDELAAGQALISFFDCHTHLATPSLLARAGVIGPRDFADNSEIVCRDGVPTGELREFGAYDVVNAALPRPSREERLDRVAGVFARLNGVGLTGAHMMNGSPMTFELLRELEANGRLTARVVAPLWVKPEQEYDELVEWTRLVGERGRLWTGGTAKLFVDGVIETGTAWLEEPDTRGEGTRSFWPDPARYAETVALFAAAGFQCVTHAIGDRAVRAALDAYREAGAAPGVRHRIEHAEVLADRELPRFAAEGVTCSMQPLHMQWRNGNATDEWTVRVGDRKRRAYRARDVLASGATLTLGSDWPVASLDPRVGMAWAQLRRRPGVPDAPVFEPDQCLTGAQTLAGYTSAPAFAASQEHEQGRIAPGFRADLTALAADPATVPPDDLPKLPVRLTVVDGRIVHHDL